MKLIIDIDNNDYELINKTGVTLDLNTVFHGKEKDKEMTFAIFDLVKALKNGIPYEERPQGETNAEIFQQTFGIYATELWSMKEADFLKWLNAEQD